jgi:hypothetical protein
VKAGRPEDLGTFDAERDAFAAALTGWAERQAAGLLERADAKADGPPDFFDLWAAQSPERQAQLAALIAGYGFRLAQIGAWSVLGVWNPEADGWDPAVMEAWLAVAAASHAAQYEQAAYTAATAAVRDEGDWHGRRLYHFPGPDAMGRQGDAPLQSACRLYGGPKGNRRNHRLKEKQTEVRWSPSPTQQPAR